MTRQNQCKRFIVVFLLFAVTGNCAGMAFRQATKNDSTFGIFRLTPQFGIVVPHHEDMVYFVNDFSYGLDVNFGITKYDRSWHQYINYPEIGIGVFYNSFGNSEIYGSAVSAYGYIMSNLYRSKKLNIRTKVALGLGYVTRPFDKDTNPYNHVFGSHMNVYINFGLSAKYRISPRISTSFTTSFNHLSNGAIQKPNHGVNTLTGGIGIEYNLNKSEEPITAGKVRAPLSNARDLVVFLSYGRSHRSVYKSNYYPAITLNVNHLWWISKKTAWGVGLDGIYYGAAPFEYSIIEEQWSVEQYDFSAADKMYGCVFASYNFRFDHTQLFVHVGAYLLYKTKPKQLIYPRMGVRQQIFRDLHANFSIKASFFSAEFIEFGLGYRFNYKKNSL
jgi:hypothetical protein